MTLLSLSVSGSVLSVLLIFAARLFKNRVSKAFSYYIWIIVLIRLVVPLSSHVNIVGGLFAPVRESAAVFETSSQTSDAEAAETTVSSAASVIGAQKASDAETAPEKPGPFERLWSFIKTDALWIWAVGAFLSIAWYAGAYMRFVSAIRRTSVSLLPEDRRIFRRVCRCGRVDVVMSKSAETPMLIGVFRPCIVLPCIAYAKNGMSRELENIIRHELMHYKRKDIFYKWTVVITTSLHWFNPLMIVIRKEISRACELSCDEAVISGMTGDERQLYGETLLTLSSNRRVMMGELATMLCEEKNELKERLLNIMNNKKRTGLAALISVILAVMLSGCGAVLGAAGGTSAASVSTAPAASIQQSALSSADTTAAPKAETAVASEAAASETAVSTPVVTAASTSKPADKPQTSKTVSTAKQSAENSADAGVRESNEKLFEKTRTYLLKGSSAWSESFLAGANFESTYSSYLNDGGKKGDAKAFAAYMTENAPIQKNWKKLFEKDFAKDYSNKIDSYEDLGGGMYAVHVTIDGKDVAFVTVNARTGWYHG